MKYPWDAFPNIGIAGVPIPPSHRVPIRRLRKELTSGVNNRSFSVADTDRILERVRLRNDSIATIADQYDCPPRTIIRICADAGMFVKLDEASA